MTDLDQARLALGVAAVLSVADAVALLPCRDVDARAWLRDEGLIHDHPVLGRVVVWGEVVERIRRPEAPAPQPKPVLQRAGLRPREK